MEVKGKGVLPTNNIIGNGRKKLLIIGKTGTGKSSLCNVITGNAYDAPIFQVSSSASTCTQRTQFAEANFNNNKERPISIIDTIGFDDPDKDDDAQIIAELVDKLNNACDYINLFVIAVNGQNPRLDGSLIAIIKIFEGMFTEQFWKQVVIVFTRMPMDKKSVQKREKINDLTDEKLAQNYLKEIEKRFHKGINLKYLYLDACYDAEDGEERNALKSGLEQLYQELNSSPNLATLHVRQVETTSAALKRQIAQKEEDRRRAEEEFHKELRSIRENHQLTMVQKEQEIAWLKQKNEENGYSSRGFLRSLGSAATDLFRGVVSLFRGDLW